MKFHKISKKLFYFISILLLLSPVALIFLGHNNDYASKEQVNYSPTLSDPNSNIILADFTGCYQIEVSQTNINQTHWYIHIPVITQNQCPVIIHDVWSTPLNIIKNYRINSQSFSDENYLLEVNFTQIPSPGLYKIFWKISVFILYESYLDIPTYIPKVNTSELPSDVMSWLLSSEFIQSDHPDIQSKAEALAGIEINAIKIVNDIIDYTANDIDYGVDPMNYSQDALSSLHREQAVCTGKANLAAALLRACGIPTRVHMIYPTHFIIECYLFPYGWIRFEPSLGITITEPLLIPTDSFESAYLYVSAFCASHIDEFSSNIVNGFSPATSGVIAYWAPTDESILFSIDVINDWEIDCYTLTGLQESLNKIFNITKDVWKYIVLYNQNDTWNNFFVKFPITLNLLNQAYSYFTKGNVIYYNSLMEQVLCKLINNDDQFVCVINNNIKFDSISFLLVSTVILGITLLMLRKKVKIADRIG